jgi:hypothetical protein
MTENRVLGKRVQKRQVKYQIDLVVITKYALRIVRVTVADDLNKTRLDKQQKVYRLPIFCVGK